MLIDGVFNQIALRLPQCDAGWDRVVRPGTAEAAGGTAEPVGALLHVFISRQAEADTISVQIVMASSSNATAIRRLLAASTASS
jgi:hypothetical protein